MKRFPQIREEMRNYPHRYILQIVYDKSSQGEYIVIKNSEDLNTVYQDNETKQRVLKLMVDLVSLQPSFIGSLEEPQESESSFKVMKDEDIHLMEGILNRIDNLPGAAQNQVNPN